MSASDEPTRHGWFRRHHEAADAPPPRRVRKVLSIDGGGIRGVIPAMILADIEKRTGKPTADLFDLVAGTSTGGMIALALNLPGRDGRPALSAQAAAGLYEELGGKIFARSRRDALRNLGALLHEKYSVQGLEEVLADTFGDARLSQSLTEVLVTAYELTRRETYAFSSRLARTDPSLDFPMRVAARATTAAPTYFEPALISGLDGRARVFIDGAVFANNPSMGAFAEVESQHPGDDLLIVSLGAGSMTRSFEYDQVKDWGAAQWARPILDIVIDGASEGVDQQLRQLLGPERYFRFQVPLRGSSDDLDDVRPENLRALKATAAKQLSDAAAQLDAVCARLV